MRLLAVVAGVAAAAALASGAQGESSAAHPCTLISNKDVARIGPGGFFTAAQARRIAKIVARGI
jgi:hypothetical protein